MLTHCCTHFQHFLSIRRIIWWHGKLLEGCKNMCVCSGMLTRGPAPVPAPGECTGNHHLLISLSLAHMIDFHGTVLPGKLHHGFHAAFEHHYCSPPCCLLIRHYKKMPLTVDFLSLRFLLFTYQIWRLGKISDYV